MNRRDALLGMAMLPAAVAVGGGGGAAEAHVAGRLAAEHASAGSRAVTVNINGSHLSRVEVLRLVKQLNAMNPGTLITANV